MLSRYPLRLAAIVAGGVDAACTLARPDHMLRAATGSVGHQLCSAAFVSGVDPDRFFAESLAPEPSMGLVEPALRYDVDRESREVRATIAGGFASRAVDRDVAGCVLVHDVLPVALPADVVLTEAAPSLRAMVDPELVVPQSEQLRGALERAFA